MAMNKLALAVTLSMGLLAGTAYAANPSDMLSLDKPLIPLQRICKLTINDSKSFWGNGRNYTFRINNDQSVGSPDEKMLKQFTCIYSDSHLKCDGGNDNTVTFDCSGTQYFWVEGKYAPSSSASNCGSGPKWSCDDKNWQWKYWSYGLSAQGVAFSGFVLGTTGGGNAQMCYNNPPADANSTCQ